MIYEHDVGDPLVLNVTPDTPLSGGDPVSLSLSDADPGSFALLLVGQDPGPFPFGELTLGLVPITGEIAFDAPTPDPLPTELSGQIFLMQGLTLGIDFSAPEFTILWRLSNVDTLEIA